MRWLALVLIGCGAHAAAPAQPERHDHPPADPPPSTAAVTQVAVGVQHSCALHANGAVSCWGNNEHRQLGVAGGAIRAEPVGVPGIAGAVELVAYQHAACTRHADGAVRCWGDILSTNVPTGPRVMPFRHPAVQLANRCVRTATGGVECLRDSLDHAEPIANIDGATDVANIADTGCAVLAQGHVACWRNSPVALPVPTLARAVQVAVGPGFGCARLHSGQVKCWPMGEPEGDDSPAPRAETASSRGRVEPHLAARDMVPKAVPIRDARSITTDDAHVCAIRRGGTFACADPGEATLIEASVAQKQLAGITALAVGQHSCAIAPGGVWCWGFGLEGQLGNGWARNHRLPIAVPDLHDVVDVVANLDGEPRTCVRRRDGSAWCFGNIDRTSGTPAPVKLEVKSASAISATELIAVIDHDGAVWNPYLRSPPERIPMPPAKLISDECAATVTGDLYCFGNARPGDKDPAQVIGASNIVALAGYSQGACFVRGDGTAACYRGQTIVIEVPGLHDARSVAIGTDLGGNRIVCFVRAIGAVACFTDDQPERMATTPAPTPMLGLTDVRALSLGMGFGCALHGDGTVVCWGQNTEGQLGDGTLLPHDKPARVLGVTTAVAIAVGDAHGCAALRDGSLVCWGLATYGQIGTLAMNYVVAPQLVEKLAH